MVCETKNKILLRQKSVCVFLTKMVKHNIGITINKSKVHRDLKFSLFPKHFLLRIQKSMFNS